MIKKQDLDIIGIQSDDITLELVYTVHVETRIDSRTFEESEEERTEYIELGNALDPDYIRHHIADEVDELIVSGNRITIRNIHVKEICVRKNEAKIHPALKDFQVAYIV